VTYQQAGGRVDPEHRPAIGAGNFKNLFFHFSHFNPELYALC
jgi:hypothetical protein